jgi:hypothetical protein
VSARSTVVWAFALCVGLAGAARAEGLDADARERADVAFSEWRLGALDGILAGAESAADLEPLLVRDLFWRPTSGGAAGGDVRDDGSLSARRAAWLRARRFSLGGDRSRDPYPTPAPGEVEPYPRITALVLDRVRRETRGASGLEDASPLADAPWAREVLVARRSAHDGFPVDPVASKRLASAMSRNRGLGLVAVAVLLAGAAVAWRRVGRPDRARARA